jgi:hypothetical protein
MKVEKVDKVELVLKTKNPTEVDPSLWKWILKIDDKPYPCIAQSEMTWDKLVTFIELNECIKNMVD